jgi:plastocyanin
MKLDRLPVGEAIIGFLMLSLLVTFILAKDTIGTPADEGADGGEPTATTPSDGNGGGGELEITMTDNKFDQTALTVAADTDVSVPLTNNGAAIHNVHVATADGTYPAAFCTVGGETPCSDPARINGGGTGVLNFNLPAGDYPFRCDYHPVEMTGTFTVE